MSIDKSFLLTLGAGILSGVVVAIIVNSDKFKGAFDVTNDENVVNSAFESVYSEITGKSDADPGGDFYTATHNEDGSVKWWAAPLWFLDRVAGIENKGVSW